MKSLQLAAIRIVRRSSQLGIAIAVIAIMQSTLVLSTSALPTVESQSVEQAINNLQPAERWISVNLGDSTQLGSSEISQNAISSLAGIDSITPRHSITFRPISDQSAGRFQLVGTDEISKDLKLASGIMPTKCDLTKCEVVAVNPDGLTQVPEGFTIVGTGDLVESTPLLSAIEPGTALLVTAGATNVINLKSVAGYPATELWSVPVAKSTIQNVGLSKYLEKINKISSELSLNTGKLLVVGPIGVLENTKAQVKILSLRMLSLELTLCLISSFIIFFIARASRDYNEAFLKSVQRISPELITVNKFQFSISTISTFAATFIGIVFSLTLVLIFKDIFNFNAIDLRLVIFNLISSLILIWTGLSASKKLTSAFLTFIFVSWIGFAQFLELDYKLSFIPIASALIIVVITNFSQKFIKNKFIKNIYLSKRSQFIALGLVTSLLVSTVISAITYLSALNRNVIDNAIFQSPTATRITMGGEAQTMQFNSFADYKNYSNNSEVFGVKKISTVFNQNVVNAFPTQLVGVDPRVWNYVPDISHQTKFDLKQASSVLPPHESKLGPSIAGARKLTVEVSGLNEHTSLGIWIINDRQESLKIDLTQSNSVYFCELPANVTNLIGFQITELADFKSRREHAVNEGINALPAPEGVISITNLKLDEVTSPFKPVLNVAYSVISGPIYLTQVAEVPELPAFVDIQTADAVIDNSLRLKVTNEHSVALKIVGEVAQLPTVPMRFALVNPDALIQFLASTTPELLRTSEVWLTNPIAQEKLGPDSLYGLTVIDQQQLKDKNLTPSNAKWSTYALVFISLIAVILLILISVFIISTISHEPQISGWHASGYQIKQLRKRLFWKINLVISFSVITTALISLALVSKYVKQIPFDINGNIAYPPLVVIFEPLKILGLTTMFILTLQAATTWATKNLKKSSVLK